MQKGNTFVSVLIWGLIIWGAISLFGSDHNDYSDSYTDTAYDSGSYDVGNETGTFHGYDCTDDCSGHEAGYNWAEENDISDVNSCDGNSDSFNEGCTAFVEENY